MRIKYFFFLFETKLSHASHYNRISFHEQNVKLNSMQILGIFKYNMIEYISKHTYNDIYSIKRCKSTINHTQCIFHVNSSLETTKFLISSNQPQYIILICLIEVINN